jgi:hypothetical protein
MQDRKHLLKKPNGTIEAGAAVVDAPQLANIALREQKMAKMAEVSA